MYNKANIHLKQHCLPERGNSRLARERKQIPGSLIVLWASWFRFVTGDELGNYSCGWIGNQRPDRRLGLVIPLRSPQILEMLWLQQLRKQNKM